MIVLHSCHRRLDQRPTTWLDPSTRSPARRVDAAQTYCPKCDRYSHRLRPQPCRRPDSSCDRAAPELELDSRDVAAAAALSAVDVAVRAEDSSDSR